MFKLSETPVKEEYLSNTGQICKLGKEEVTIETYHHSTRTGTYERGFKFHTSVIGILVGKGRRYSADHGATWSGYKGGAVKLAGRKKFVISRDTQKEFAYDKIQAINAQYGIF